MNMREILKKLIKNSLEILKIDISESEIFIDVPKNEKFGDYSTNIALKISKEINKEPIKMAEQIIANIKNINIEKIEIANAGFINFYMNKKYLSDNINTVISEGSNYGKSNIGNNEKINIEYVSANPTGILHLGHARGASYGDSLSRIMKFAGFDVTREYYINDAGNQINNLTQSIIERYKEICGLNYQIPEDGYHGEEIKKIAINIYDMYGDKLLTNGIDEELFKQNGLNALMSRIKKDLEDFRVNFDVWTSEQELYNSGKVDLCLSKLKDLGLTYELDGALFLKTTEFSDEKDRVLIKNDQTYTYLVPDIANHLDKYNRGFDQLIDVFGADHHGYVPRLKSGIQALGYDREKLDVKILQMVRLIQNAEEVKMSKRTGKTVSMSDLIEEVGLNATRYFFAMRSLDTQMDFDIDLARKKNNENPVYYVEYAYARICSILKNASMKNIGITDKFMTFDNDNTYNILKKIYEFKNIVELAAIKKEPHLITNYLYDLASEFHGYYAKEKIITEDLEYSQERVTLITAIKLVIENALNLIGVIPREEM